MSTAQAAAATSFVAGGALAGSAAGGAFKGGASLESKSTNENTQDTTSLNPTTSDLEGSQNEVEDGADLAEDGQSLVPPPRVPKTQEEHLKNLRDKFKERLSDVIPKSEANKGEYKGKIGEKYAYFLSSPRTVSANYSEDWWNASYEMYQDFLQSSPENLSTEFSKGNVTSAFSQEKSNDEGKELNKVCLRIYKQEESTITKQTENDNNDKLRKNLWKFCSPLGSEPITISQSSKSNDYTGKIGANDTTSLISVLDESNDFFWKIKGLEFLSTQYKDQQTFDDEFFKKYFYDHQNKTMNQRGQIPSFKDQCEKAYKATAETSKSTANAPTQAVAKKYCSFVIPLS